MVDNMIPVFVISLSRSAERREMACKQMKHLGIQFSFFDAIDGRNLTEGDVGLVDMVEAKAFSGHELSPGEIGCALSHIKLYEMMVAKTSPSGLRIYANIFAEICFVCGKIAKIAER